MIQVGFALRIKHCIRKLENISEGKRVDFEKRETSLSFPVFSVSWIFLPQMTV